jgi:hypothetical protein
MFKFFEHVWAWSRVVIKRLARILGEFVGRDARDVAIAAPVSTPLIKVSRQRRIFEGFAFWLVNDGHVILPVFGGPGAVLLGTI